MIDSGYHRQSPSTAIGEEGTVLPGQFISFDEVEARLIEAMRVQWRLERAAWPFASDGPWHLIVRDWWDWAAHEDRPVPRVPPSRDQLARADEAARWLAHAPERDRKLVVLAVMALASGRKVVPWRGLLRPMGLRLGADGLRKRYGRAVNAICAALNGAEMRA